MTGQADRLLPVATAARTRAAVAELLAPARAPLAVAVAALALATGASLLVAPRFGHLIDRVEGGDPGALGGPVAALVGLALAQAVLTAVGAALLARVGETALAQLRERVVDRALALPLDRIEQGGSGDLVSRLGPDVAAIGAATRGALPQMANAVLLMALTLVALVALDVRFLLVALLVAPLQGVAARWYLRTSSPVYAAARRVEGDLETQVLETVAEAGTVRALGLAPSRLARARDPIERGNQLSFVAADLETRFAGRLHLAEALGLLVVLAVSFALVDGGALSVGTAGAAALYLVALFRPVRTALLQLDPLQSASAGLARVVGVTDLPGPVPSPAGSAAADGTVALDGVAFSYDPGTVALHPTDLEVPPGATVAVVGPSGAGKSTLAKLVAGVHRPDRGTVRVGGRAVEEPGVAAGRPVVLVTQEVHVFAGPLAGDLRLVAPDATDGDLGAALDAVGAREWAEALPAGLDTIVGEAGHRLTPVQAQQVALARVVLADPLVAVLDEATAEAGSAGARALDAAAAAALRGRTGLVVAHRLSQAAGADLVLVVEEGRVVQAGPHGDLLAVDGPYAALWSAWRTRQDGGAPPGA